MSNKIKRFAILLLILMVGIFKNKIVFSYPTVYPTGVTIYNPEKAWNGYTVFQLLGKGALLVDMNGREVKLWEGLYGEPNKLLPNGHIMGNRGLRNPKYSLQDMVDLVEVDWDGNVVWEFSNFEKITDPGEDSRFMARQHHDYQREGNSVGYYVPGMDPKISGGKTLILAHKNVINKEISDQPLLDDIIYEVDSKGNIIWQWLASEHFSEMGFSEEAKKAIRKDPNMRNITPNNQGDWLHINSMSTLGPNKWYDQGDERFHPDNIIWSGRDGNISGIIDKKTGKIVWKLGPDYNSDPKMREIGEIIGQHHTHMIPNGLPGAGNTLLFDNGGWAGYGDRGKLDKKRDYSRVLEIDPITFQIVWQYTPKEAGFRVPLDAYRFYSPFISSAQRLPNGNTLITEGANGRILEVTKNHEIVWEYINPYWDKDIMGMNMLYRAYRAPYEWVPQVKKPKEKEVKKIQIEDFRVPGSAPKGGAKVTKVSGTLPYFKETTKTCIVADNE